MKEEFRPIEGDPGYLVSNMGRILSLKRREPVLLSIRQNRTGYAEGEVFSHGKVRFINIGREVLAAFRGYPADPWLCVVKHVNGDLMDCRLDNLEWVICETDETYDPELSKRKGVLKPEHTKDRMSDAKCNQSAETIRKAVIARTNNLEYRRMFKNINGISETYDAIINLDGK